MFSPLNTIKFQLLIARTKKKLSIWIKKFCHICQINLFMFYGFWFQNLCFAYYSLRLEVQWRINNLVSSKLCVKFDRIKLDKCVWILFEVFRVIVQYYSITRPKIWWQLLWNSILSIVVLKQLLKFLMVVTHIPETEEIFNSA